MTANLTRTGRRSGIGDRRASGRLNVLQVVGICGGGLGRHVRALCRDLAASGHSVTAVYAPHDVDPAFHRFADQMQGTIRFVPMDLRREVDPMSDLRGVGGLLNLIGAAGPFDVVHGHSAKGGAIARIAGRISGVPTVYTPHSFIASSPEISATRATAYNWIERSLGHLATSRMVAVSEGEREFARKLRLAPEGRVVLIPNGLEEGDLKGGSERGPGEDPDLDQKPLTFGTALRFSEQKAPGLLVDAFAELLRASPGLPMKLVIAGDGELYGEVKKRVINSGMNGRISLPGWRTDTKAVLGELDVFVLPSLHEGFSYSLLEAMAARLPVVSTEVFGARETVLQVPGNVTVPPGDPSALAEGMKRAASMAKPEFLRRTLKDVGERNHKYVEKHYTQREASRRTVALYQTLRAEAMKSTPRNGKPR